MLLVSTVESEIVVVHPPFFLLPPFVFSSYSGCGHCKALAPVYEEVAGRREGELLLSQTLLYSQGA